MRLADAYSTATVRGLLDLPRDSCYRQGEAAQDERPLIEALLSQTAQWPTYGYRRRTVMLRGRGGASTRSGSAG